MISIVSAFWKRLRVNPARHWIFIFILINVFLSQSSGGNPASRLATMEAMSERTSFEVLSDWSMDVSVAPDGKIYSNKAPGPMFLGFPVFYVVDWILVKWRPDPQERHRIRVKSVDAYYFPLNFFFQILPYAILVALLVELLLSWGLSLGAVHFAALALLFGNTASIFMNSWFGHGVAAVFVVAMYLALVRKNYFWAAFFFGWALLSDYGLASLLPSLLVWVCWEEGFQFKKWKMFSLGTLVPGLLWIFYHVICFGGPFEVALKHQDPAMHNFASVKDNVWGIMTSLPKPSILYDLVFGSFRGLLVTQPWILLLTLLVPFYLRGHRQLQLITILSVPSLILLLCLNATFGGWWAGGSSGPRYLSVVLPLFAVMGAFLFDGVGKSAKGVWLNRVLILSLAVAILLTLLVHATTSQAFPGPLWSWLADRYLEPSRLPNSLLRSFVLLVLVGWATHRSVKEFPKFSSRSY